ncbi:hypothetical protein EYZ11_008910 [Aspergillus tanneri]|uniref:Uncharacterized protein n=1 Tax=Aspergillus tanneri TaxID=1220188 RepID=A0A4S3J9C1_9EURO|nr:hypothetical protein EYZ11_008910 [Aspergillus tanneri]
MIDQVKAIDISICPSNKTQKLSISFQIDTVTPTIGTSRCKVVGPMKSNGIHALMILGFHGIYLHRESLLVLAKAISLKRKFFQNSKFIGDALAQAIPCVNVPHWLILLLGTVVRLISTFRITKRAELDGL